MNYKIVENGYIVLIGIGENKYAQQMSKEEYDKIMAVIENKPKAQQGYDYKLKEDLTWELCEMPIVEITEEEYQEAVISNE